jgi:hypothetical protein
MQAGDSLRVSNACEMVQISTRLSRFFRWAWPPASENGAATTMDENKLLAGEFCNGIASNGQNFIRIPQYPLIRRVIMLEFVQKSIRKHFILGEML